MIELINCTKAVCDEKIPKSNQMKAYLSSSKEEIKIHFTFFCKHSDEKFPFSSGSKIWA